MKQITINVPDNCELKQYGNSYVIVEKEKKLTYNDVINNLFTIGEELYYIDTYGAPIHGTFRGSTISDGNIFKSKKQAEKLLAINKLMNVAKYLNGDWQPDWNCDMELKFSIEIYEKSIQINFNTIKCINAVYFKSEKLAQQAIEILGEETIKLALCTDY